MTEQIEEPTESEINSYLDNLNEEGLRMLAAQLLLYTGNRGFIHKAIKEFDKFYKFHLNGKEDEKNGTR